MYKNNIYEKEILKKVKNHLETAGRPYFNCSDVFELVELLVSWYQFKYPDRAFDFYEYQELEEEFVNLKSISHAFNFDQFKFRVSDHQLAILNNYYVSGKNETYIVYDEDGKENRNRLTKININHVYNVEYFDFPQFKSSFQRSYLEYEICVDEKNGMVICDNSYHFPKEKFNSFLITDVLKKIEAEKDHKIDYSNLKKVVTDHDNVSLIREKIICAAVIELINRSSDKDYGIIRAQRFINEMNKKLDLHIFLEDVINYNNSRKSNNIFTKEIKRKK